MFYCVRRAGIYVLFNNNLSKLIVQKDEIQNDCIIDTLPLTVSDFV